MKNRYSISWLTWLLLALQPLSLIAQTAPTPELTYKTIVIIPAAVPTPSLRYRLLPTPSELRPGNAALEYKDQVGVLPKDDEFKKQIEKLNDYLDMPIDRLKEHLQEAKDASTYNETPLQHATSRMSCDWQETLEEGFGMLVPNLSEYRSIAKMVALKARIEIAQGHFDQAFVHLKQAFALAHNLGKGRTIIQHLVGIAIAQTACKQIETMIQQPGCPNLYWTLTILPDPLVDIRLAAMHELSLYEFFCPGIKDIDRRVMTVQEATETINKIFSAISMEQDLPSYFGTGIVLAGYGRAKAYLKEKGYDPAWVEQIPSAQAILMWQWLEYAPLQDEVIRWFFVDYSHAAPEWDKIEKKLASLPQPNQQPVMTGFLVSMLSSLPKCNLQMARHQRTVAVLRVIEAIRAYAQQEGRLPRSLDQITFVPVPNNPITGQPFDYEWREDGARLTATDPEPKRMEGYLITLKP